MNVTILGVAETGRAIAKACASAGHTVSIYADHPSDAMDAIDLIERRLEDEEVMDPDLDGTTGLRAAITGADIVIETVEDDEAALRELLWEIEMVVDADTIIATSQPTMSIEAVGNGLDSPERLVGLRFQEKRDLVEVVGTDTTAPDVIDRISAFIEEIELVPVYVSDTPGMVSDRLVAALEVEAMRLLDSGVADAETIDELLVTGHGHPVGPLERADRIGLDHRLEELSYLAEELGERYQPPDILESRVALGKTGEDVGEGFYVWERGDPIKSAGTESSVDRPEH